MNQYQELRELIINGNLKIFRNELIHVLYKKYISQIKSMVKHIYKKYEENPDDGNKETSRYIEQFDTILKHKVDFVTDEFPLYKKEVSYLENILKGLIKMPGECVKLIVNSDPRYQAIVSDSRPTFSNDRIHSLRDSKHLQHPRES
jgi:hypothetical protein